MPKKCKYCDDPFKPKFSSLEKHCQKEDCRIKYAIEEVAKQKVAQKKQIEKKWKQQKIILKENTTNWKNSLQNEINKIVRLIDKDLPCLAKKKGGQIHAGHIFSRGSSATIRYNLHNIHRQNAQSNHFQNDDGLLREGLVNEYGQEYMDFISQLRSTPQLQYKNFQYKEFTKEAQKIVLHLSKLNLNYSLKNRILMRNKINNDLGIYESEFCVFDNFNNINNTHNINNIDNINNV
jgi:hypothetical protein